MKRLKNGAIELARTEIERVGQGVVLGETPHGTQRYATWRVDSADNTFWGHYFDTMVDARADYCKRISSLTSIL